jgi:hypothetical protein
MEILDLDFLNLPAAQRRGSNNQARQGAHVNNG